MSISLATQWAVAHWAPLSMGFSRQEYWGGLPGPPPGDLPVPEIQPASLMSPAFASGFFTTSPAWEALFFDGDLHTGYALISGWDHCIYINVFVDTKMYLDSQAVGNGEQVFKLSKLPRKMGINRASSREMVFSSVTISLRGKPFSHYFSILNLFPCPVWLNLSEMGQTENLASSLSLEIITSSHFHGLFWNGDLSFMFHSQLK